MAIPAIALMLSLPASVEASQAPKRFFGVHPRSIQPGDYADMRAADVGLLRTAFYIQAVRSHPGDPYDWSEFDAIVDGTATNGIELLPVLLGVPKYISTKPYVIPLGNSESEWRDYLSALVARYGPGGEFWSLNPETPYRPIGEWQIWNEQNALTNWEGKPSPREYGRLLAISADAIHEEDPAAKLVTGGVISQPQNPKAMDGVDYLRKLLESKTVARVVDIIAIHPYSDTPNGVKKQVKLTRSMLDESKLEAPIWVTEIGWGSGSSDRNPQIVSPARQRSNLRGSFEMALKQRKRLGLERMVWYQWRDGEDTICNWCGTSGLLDADGVAKPLLDVFREIARL